MIPIIAAIVNFLVLVGIIVYLGKKPAQAMLIARREKIQKQIAEGEEQSRLATAQLVEWETKWKQSEAHAKQAQEDAKANLARYREKGMAAAKSEAERIRHEAKVLAQSEQAKSKRGLGREVAEKALKSAQQYLRSHLDDAEKHKLVIDYVDRLEKVNVATS